MIRPDSRHVSKIKLSNKIHGIQEAKWSWCPRIYRLLCRVSLTPTSIFPDLFAGVFFLLEDSRRHRNLLKSVSIDRYRAAFFRLLGSEFPLSTDLSFPVIPVVVCTPLYPILCGAMDRSFCRLTSYSINASINSPRTYKNIKEVEKLESILEKIITILSWILYLLNKFLNKNYNICLTFIKYV